MGLLAPLYALAAMAIVGPIIFHLIKRQPTGQQRFSSLMFLTPSPPRLTRRSRLDNILLLILRSLAIALIAVAFARPFFRQESFLDRSLEGRNIALLIDTSASMQRADVWESAGKKAKELLDSLSPADRVSLYTIDDALHSIVPLDTESRTDVASQRESVRGALAELKPSWRGSKVADGLRSLADLFQAASIAGKIDAASQSELVFISDLHANCGVDSLQGYPWPEAIRLDVRQVRATTPGNARASLLAADAESKADGTLKVRVENNADSTSGSFQLKWIASGAPIASAGTAVQVPPGQTRTISIPAQPPNADRLELTGDSWDGDNSVYVAKPLPKLERVIFVGEQANSKEDDLAYFLEKAPLSTGLVRRTIERVAREQLADVLTEAQAAASQLAGEKIQAIVIEPPVSSVDASGLREFAAKGGCVIMCLARQAIDLNALGNSIREVLAVEQVSATEAVTKDFSLLSAIDYTSPVFKPFADPRFNDFSKIRVWSHRRLDIHSTTSDSVQVIASLDDGSPWLLRKPVGAGNLWLMTSGWQPASSQFGLSSKFIPILIGMLDPTGKTLNAQLVYSVGEPVPTDDLPNLAVTNADGLPVETKADNVAIQLDTPGLYNLQSNGIRRQIAIQIPYSEVQLTPLDVDVFEQYGVELGKVQSDAERKQAARQLQAFELERKQRVWQWLLLGGLVVLAVETVLAGWFARRSSYNSEKLVPQTVG